MNSFFLSSSDQKTIVRKIFRTILVSLLLYITSQCLQFAISKFEAGSFSMKSMSSHENQILNCKIHPHDITETLESVGGLSEIKNEIRMQVLLPLSRPSLFFNPESSIMRPPKGILLHGPPGTGKTMLAKAIAKEAGCPFLSISLSTLEDKFFGETSKLIKALFSVARKIQPCIIFFDEIDGMIRKRNEFDQSHVYGMKTEFLSQVDGINSSQTDSVIMIACTNCVESLDPAVKRRLPHRYFVDVPTKKELEEIFSLHIKAAGQTIDKEDVAHMVEACRPGVTGSDMKSAVEEAARVHLMQAGSTEEFKTAILKSDVTTDELKVLLGCVTRDHFLEALKSMALLKKKKIRDDFFSKPSKEAQVIPKKSPAPQKTKEI